MNKASKNCIGQDWSSTDGMQIKYINQGRNPFQRFVLISISIHLSSLQSNTSPTSSNRLVFRQELFKNIKMQFTTALIAIFASIAIAAPTGDGHNGGGSTPAPYDPCSGLYDSAQCCATDVLGVANLDCASRKLKAILILIN